MNIEFKEVPEIHQNIFDVDETENPEESGLIQYAQYELGLLITNATHGTTLDDTNIQKAMNTCIINIIREFSKQQFPGFSEASAIYVIDVLTKLLQYIPLSPLTGADDEWVDVSAYGLQPGVISIKQNKRSFNVFKETLDDGIEKVYQNEKTLFFITDTQQQVMSVMSTEHNIVFPYDSVPIIKTVTMAEYQEMLKEYCISHDIPYDAAQQDIIKEDVNV